MTGSDTPVRAVRPLPIVSVVGVSAAGKSTLVAALRAAGYDARSISQEHANVPDLWRRFDVPRALIYLDVSLDAQRARRDDVAWSEAARMEEIHRLTHARQHADLVINTSALAPASVLGMVLSWLRAQKVRCASTPLPPGGATGAPIPSPAPRTRQSPTR